jgi:hypothetical protein
MVIEPYDDTKREAIVELSLRAWAPVFDSLREAMLPAVFQAFYRGDWRAVALKVHAEDQMGEIYMIATDPDFHDVASPPA